MSIARINLQHQQLANSEQLRFTWHKLWQRYVCGHIRKVFLLTELQLVWLFEHDWQNFMTSKRPLKYWNDKIDKILDFIPPILFSTD